MGKKAILMRIGIVCAMISFIGCAVFREPVDPIYPAGIESDQYSIEIARLEAITSEKSRSSKRWRAHHQLAQLYASYKNPKRNYIKSLENLRLYLPHHPTSLDDHDLQSWLSVLNEIESLPPIIASQNKKIEQLTTSLMESRQANLALEEVNSKIEKDNADLAAKIDVLKTLDQGVEEKREKYIP